MNRTYWVKAREPTPHPTLGRGYCFYTNNCYMAMATVPRLRMLELILTRLISSVTEHRLQGFSLWECLN